MVMFCGGQCCSRSRGGKRCWLRLVCKELFTCCSQACRCGAHGPADKRLALCLYYCIVEGLVWKPLSEMTQVMLCLWGWWLHQVSMDVASSG